MRGSGRKLRDKGADCQCLVPSRPSPATPMPPLIMLPTETPLFEQFDRMEVVNRWRGGPMSAASAEGISTRKLV